MRKSIKIPDNVDELIKDPKKIFSDNSSIFSNEVDNTIMDTIPISKLEYAIIRPVTNGYILQINGTELNVAKGEFDLLSSILFNITGQELTNELFSKLPNITNICSTITIGYPIRFNQIRIDSVSNGFIITLQELNELSSSNLDLSFVVYNVNELLDLLFFFITYGGGDEDANQVQD